MTRREHLRAQMVQRLIHWRVVEIGLKDAAIEDKPEAEQKVRDAEKKLREPVDFYILLINK